MFQLSANEGTLVGLAAPVAHCAESARPCGPSSPCPARCQAEIAARLPLRAHRPSAPRQRSTAETNSAGRSCCKDSTADNRAGALPGIGLKEIVRGQVAASLAATSAS